MAAPSSIFRQVHRRISITIIVPLHDRDILEYAEQVVEAAALISSRMGYNAADQQWT